MCYFSACRIGNGFLDSVQTTHSCSHHGLSLLNNITMYATRIAQHSTRLSLSRCLKSSFLIPSARATGALNFLDFTTPLDIQLQQQRWKHSKRQVKRLFNKNPARLRAEERMGIDRSPQPIDPPTYSPIFEPQLLSNGWSAPPRDGVTIPDYPFQVKRTKNKPNDAVGFLPVYSKMRYAKINFSYHCKLDGSNPCF